MTDLRPERAVISTGNCSTFEAECRAQLCHHLKVIEGHPVVAVSLTTYSSGELVLASPVTAHRWWCGGALGNVFRREYWTISPGSSLLLVWLKPTVKAHLQYSFRHHSNFFFPPSLDLRYLKLQVERLMWLVPYTLLVLAYTTAASGLGSPFANCRKCVWNGLPAQLL